MICVTQQKHRLKWRNEKENSTFQLNPERVNCMVHFFVNIKFNNVVHTGLHICAQCSIELPVDEILFRNMQKHRIKTDRIVY